MSRRNIMRSITVLVAVLVVIVFPSSIQAASNKEKALRAYESFLTQGSIQWPTGIEADPSQASFALAYINKDKVPELIISNAHTDHANGFEALYTYRKGKVEGINAGDSIFYYKKTGIYVHRYSGMGHGVDWFHKLKDKQHAKLSHGWEYGVKDSDVFSDGNNTEITKRAFHKKLKKLVGSKSRITPKMTANTEENRKRLLSD